MHILDKRNKKEEQISFTSDFSNSSSKVMQILLKGNK